MQLYTFATVLAAIGGVSAQGAWIPLNIPIPKPAPVAPPPAPPVAPPPAPPVAPPPAAVPAIPANVVLAASNACAAVGQPTPYFDSTGKPAFCGPRIWNGGYIPAGTNLCP